MPERKFFGPYEVIGVEKLDYKTPLGAEVIKVSIDGGAPKIMTKLVFDLLSSPEKTDLTTLGDKKIGTVAGLLLQVMMDYSLTAIEIETLLLKVSSVCTNVFDRASHTAVTKEVFGWPLTSEWVPGSNFAHYRNLTECDMVVERYKTHNEADKPTSPSGESTEK